MTKCIEDIRVLGLTGGMGSGKSTVSRILRELGWRLVDADEVTRALHGDCEICRAIERAFGEDAILFEDGRTMVNRRVLAQRAFASPEAVSQLNAIMRPALEREVRLRLASAPGRVVLDAALLFEAGWETWCDASVVVVCPESWRVVRICVRDGVDAEAARARLRHQMRDDERLRRADLIFYNTGSAARLERQVKRVFALPADEEGRRMEALPT